MTQFVSLHVHTYFSLLDGLSSPKSLIARAKELGHPAIAISDHGVMHGAIELYREGLAEGVKPIIGCEGYLKDQASTDHLKDFVSEADGDYKVKGLFHQLVLAINATGYRNLVKLTSLAHLTEGRGNKSKKSDTSTKSKSWFTFEEIEQYNEGLIVTSGCMAGIIPQAIRAGDLEYAEVMAKRYQSTFGDRFYIEIQDHNASDGSEPLNIQLVALAQKLGIEIVCTADNHYTCERDKFAHDALLCINTGKLLTDEKRMRYEGAYWLPTGDEMIERLSRYLPIETAVRAVENTVAIANRVEDYQLKGTPTPPKFTLPGEYDNSDDYLEDLAYEGLRNRFYGMPPKDYVERLQYELDVFRSKNLAEYFLVVNDITRFCRDRGIYTGAGRGCVLPDTKVMFADGTVKNIVDFNREIGCDVITHSGKIQNVTAYHAYDCNEEIVKLKYSSELLSLTKDHKVFAVRTHECTVQAKPEKKTGFCKPTCQVRCNHRHYEEYKPEWIPAGELRKNDCMVFPRRNNWIPLDFSYDVLNFVERCDTLRFNDTHLWYEIGSNCLETVRIPRHIEFDERLAKLLGYFIAEGWTRKDTKYHTYRVGFGFCGDEQDYVEETQNLMQDLFGIKGGKREGYKGKNAISLEFNSKIVAEFLSAICSTGSNHIHIPSDIVKYGQPHLLKILVGYLFRGDGHNEKKSTHNALKYSTTSVNLANQLRLILARMGYWASIGVRKKLQEKWSDEYSVKLSGKQLWKWNEDFRYFPIELKQGKFTRNDSFYFDENYFYLKITDVENFWYEGKVYDISVPGNTSYIGNSAAIHNSAAGSLVSYALQITNIDPIHFGLIFSRFINEERMSYPDIDLDIDKERRHEVVEYLCNKYGSTQVAQIATFNRMVSASALKDTGRVLNVSYGAANEISTRIPVVRGKPAKISQMIKERDIFPQFYDAYQIDQLMPNKEGHEFISFQEWVNLAIGIEGTVKSIGIHAAGVVIGWTSLDEIVPLMKSKEGGTVTQYSMEDLEYLGLLKMDLLGLKTLSVMRRTVEAVKQLTGETINVESINLNDQHVLRSMVTGDNAGVFQFEADGAVRLLRQIKPTSLDDVSAITSLNRPGCLDLGMHTDFARRKAGLDRVTYLIPELEPILGFTYGLCVFQEQMLNICHKIAGWSLGKSDTARRSTGKKKPEVIKPLESDFINGCVDKWIDESVAAQLWEIVLASAGYTFNASHAYCYSVITMITAWLKHYYKCAFMAALMSAEDDPDDLAKYLIKCKSYGFKLLPPSINESSRDFIALDDSTIRWGLRAIKGLGEAAINPILLERQIAPFKDFADFYVRTLTDSDDLTALIKSGALDELHPNRAEMEAYLEPLKEWRTKLRAKQTRALKWEREIVSLSAVDISAMNREQLDKHWKRFDQVQKNYERAMSIDSELPPMPTKKDWSLEKRLRNEKEVLGMYASGHPLDKYPVGCEPFENLQPKQTYVGTVQVNSAREANSKQGTMMYVEIEDKLGATMSLKLFHTQWKSYKDLFKANAHVSITAKAQEWNGKLELILQVALQPTSPEPVGAIVGAWEDPDF